MNNDKDLQKNDEIVQNLQELLDNLHEKIKLAYRHWLANAILEDSYDESLADFKNYCKQICFDYLKYKIDNFKEIEYFENVVEYLDNVIQNLINSTTER